MAMKSTTHIMMMEMTTVETGLMSLTMKMMVLMTMVMKYRKILKTSWILLMMMQTEC